MMSASPVDLLNGLIGAELVRLASAGAQRFPAKVCQFGGVEVMADHDRMAGLLPAVFVNPDGETNYQDQGQLDINGTQAEVVESFRIVTFVRYDAEENALAKSIDFTRAVLLGIRSDPKLANLAETIRPHQISRSSLVAIEWQPDEQLLLTDAAVPVKVLAMRWAVRWYARG